jgi:hypothetical protein
MSVLVVPECSNGQVNDSSGAESSAAMGSESHRFGQGHVLPTGFGYEPRAQHMRREVPNEARELGRPSKGSRASRRPFLPAFGRYEHFYTNVPDGPRWRKSHTC